VTGREDIEGALRGCPAEAATVDLAVDAEMPLRCLAEPGEIATGVGFLASDESSDVLGQVLAAAEGR